MTKDQIISFFLWQKIMSKENINDLFIAFIKEKVEKEKTEINKKLKQIEELYDEILNDLGEK